MLAGRGGAGEKEGSPASSPKMNWMESIESGRDPRPAVVARASRAPSACGRLSGKRGEGGLAGVAAAAAAASPRFGGESERAKGKKEPEPL